MRHVWLAALVCGAVGLAAAPRTTQDDREDREEARLVARRAVGENCQICHGEEMIASQRLTATQWKAEVEKMVGWGSPLPKELQQPVIDYLAAEYADTAPAFKPERTTFAQALDTVRPQPETGSRLAGTAERGAPLYIRNCANCHGQDGQGAELGPNLVEKPVLARPKDFDRVVRQGDGRMPGFASTLDESAEADILAWLRAARYRPVVVK
jgi:mono/diheme cytochrome c family protein